jgi:hypothetical protein
MRRAAIGAVLVTMVIGAGCGGRLAGAGAVPGPLPGEYEFRVERGQGLPFEGLLVVTSDTVVVIPRTVACRPPATPAPRIFAAICDDVRLSIDRFTSGPPRMTATVEALRPVTRQRCVSWTVVNGRQVCAEYQSFVTEERQVTTTRVIMNRASP